MKITITVKYQPGDRVYYNLPEGPVGIVLDWRYEHLSGQVQYCVSFSCESESLWYHEFELVEFQTFN